MALGREAKGAAPEGGFILFGIWGAVGDGWKLKNMAIFQVDGKDIRPNTLYQLKDWELVEAE